MPAVIVKMLSSLAMSLLTEVFLKKVLILILEKIVAKTESDLDDKVLAAAKEAWGEEDDEGDE